jgi:autotransporter-associated beta strand protein
VPPPEGAVVSFGSLSGIPTSIISGSQNAVGPVTWRVGLLNTSTTFAGAFTPFVSGGPIGLAKAGTGTWTLTGSGNVSAGITVEAGTLSYGDDAADALTGTSAIVVSSGATLQLNQGARLAGSSCEVFSAGSLRGRGTLEAPLDSSGMVAVIGGTLAVLGNTHLSGELSLSAWTDRLAVTGDLDLSGLLTLPAAAPPTAGRYVLATSSGTLTADELTLAGVPAAFEATLDLATPGEMAVVLTPRWTFADWQADRFPDPGVASAGPTEDPDFDGLANLLEYMLDGSPSAPDHARLPVANLIGDEVVFTFVRRESTSRHSTQTFEYSTDLSIWTPLPLLAPHAELGPVANDLQTVTVRLSRPTQPSGRLVGRLRITLP